MVTGVAPHYCTRQERVAFVERGGRTAARELAQRSRCNSVSRHSHKAYRSRSNKWSPTRSALAMTVSDGLTAPIETKKPASTT
jgi:hypothetical protein